VLASIMRQPEHSDAARIQAAAILLDRGWGKPAQAHTGENGEGSIKVVIRHIVADENGEPRDVTPQIIDTRKIEGDP
jgi:hypothetical protein